MGKTAQTGFTLLAAPGCSMRTGALCHPLHRTERQATPGSA